MNGTKQYSHIERVAVHRDPRSDVTVFGWQWVGESDYILLSEFEVQELGGELKPGSQFSFGPTVLLEVQRAMSGHKVECKRIREGQ